MTTTIEPTRVLLVSENDQMPLAVHTAIENEPNFTEVNSARLVDGVSIAVEDVQPDIILLDYTYHQGEVFGLLDELTVNAPASAVVILLPPEESHQSNRLILSGASAIVTFSSIHEELLDTIRRIREMQTRTTPAKLQPTSEAVAQSDPVSQMIVVFSPKGGAGCSTIATNLTLALFQILHREILLVDGKHLLGHVALMLNIRQGNSISDLLAYAGKLDINLIRQVTIQHVSGIYVLPSPISITKAQGIRPEELYKVIIGLQAVYPYIVVDGGNHLDENLVTYMDAASKIVLVVNPNLASLRDVRQFLDIAQTLSYPREKILILLNLTGHKTDVKLSEIEHVLQSEVFGMIPADEEAVLSSLNEGIPIILKKPNHPVSRAYVKIAQKLTESVLANKGVGLGEMTGGPSETLKKSSRLG